MNPLLIHAIDGIDGIPITASVFLPEGELFVIDGPTGRVLTVGARPDDHPTVIARKIVREGMRDILDWLTNPPTYLTGREVLDKLAGRPTWPPHPTHP